MPGQDSSTTGQSYNFPENSVPLPQFLPRLSCPSPLGIQHLREINMASSASACKKKPGQGWVGGGGRWQPVRTGCLFQLHSNPVSPLGHPTSGSTPTNLLCFRQIVGNTRYRPTSSLPRGWGCLKEEEEAGLKEGVGESGLGQVLATPWLAPVR